MPPPTAISTRNKSSRVIVNTLRNPALGRRTGKNVVGDKIIRRDQKGRECFADYFSDDETEVSSIQDSASDASQSFHNNKSNVSRSMRASKSITLSRIVISEDSTVCEPRPMSPFSVNSSRVGSVSNLSPANSRLSSPFGGRQSNRKKSALEASDREAKSPRLSTTPGLIKPVPKYGYVFSDTCDPFKENAPPDYLSPVVVISDDDVLKTHKSAQKQSPRKLAEFAEEVREGPETHFGNSKKEEKSSAFANKNDSSKLTQTSNFVRSPEQDLDQYGVEEEVPLEATRLVNHEFSASRTNHIKLVDPNNSIPARSGTLDNPTHLSTSHNRSNSARPTSSLEPIHTPKDPKLFQTQNHSKSPRTPKAQTSSSTPSRSKLSGARQLPNSPYKSSHQKSDRNSASSKSCLTPNRRMPPRTPKQTNTSPHPMWPHNSSQLKSLQTTRVSHTKQPITSTIAENLDKGHTPQITRRPVSSPSKLHLEGLQNGSITFNKSVTPQNKGKSQKVKCQLSVLFMEKEVADSVVAAIHNSAQKKETVLQMADEEDDDEFEIAELPQKYLFNLHKFDSETGNKIDAAKNKTYGKGHNKSMNSYDPASLKTNKTKVSIVNKTVTTMSTSAIVHQKGDDDSSCTRAQGKGNGQNKKLDPKTVREGEGKKANVLGATTSSVGLIDQSQDNDSDSDSDAVNITDASSAFQKSSNFATSLPRDEVQMTDVLLALGLHTTVAVNRIDDSNVGRKRRKSISDLQFVGNDRDADKNKKVIKTRKVAADDSVAGSNENDNSKNVKKKVVRRHNSSSVMLTNAANKKIEPTVVAKNLDKSSKQRKRSAEDSESKTAASESNDEGIGGKPDQSDTPIDKPGNDSYDTELYSTSEMSGTETRGKNSKGLPNTKSKPRAEATRNKKPLTHTITKLVPNKAAESVKITKNLRYAAKISDCVKEDGSVENVEALLHSSRVETNVPRKKSVSNSQKLDVHCSKSTRETNNHSHKADPRITKPKNTAKNKKMVEDPNSKKNASYETLNGEADDESDETKEIATSVRHPERSGSLEGCDSQDFVVIQNRSLLKGQKGKPAEQAVEQINVISKPKRAHGNKERKTKKHCETKSNTTQNEEYNTASIQEGNDYSDPSVSSLPNDGLPNTTKPVFNESKRGRKPTRNMSSRDNIEDFAPICPVQESIAAGGSKRMRDKKRNKSSEVVDADNNSLQRSIACSPIRSLTVRNGKKRTSSTRSRSPLARHYRLNAQNNVSLARVPRKRADKVKSKSNGRSRAQVLPSQSDSPNESGYIAHANERETVKKQRRSVSDKRFRNKNSKTPKGPCRENSVVLKSLIKSLKRRELKKPTIYVPENDENIGLRRSQRQKVPTLEYWRNERVQYKRHSTCYVIDRIIEPSSSDAPKDADRPPKKRKKSKQTVNKKLKLSSDKPIRALEYPDDMTEGPTKPIPVFNPELKEEVLVDCFGLRDTKTYYGDTNEDAVNSDILICKPLQQRAFHAGEITMRIGANKQLENTVSDTLVFKVDEGQLLVRIHQTSCLVTEGDFFFVPSGNLYSLKNIGDDSAKLTFFQLRGVPE